MQMSSTKILGYLVNDMLDYTQLSAGKFRKSIKKFDLIESINAVKQIMHLKAVELGIQIVINTSHLIRKTSASLEK